MLWQIWELWNLVSHLMALIQKPLVESSAPQVSAHEFCLWTRIWQREYSIACHEDSVILFKEKSSTVRASREWANERYAMDVSERLFFAILIFSGENCGDVNGHKVIVYENSFKEEEEACKTPNAWACQIHAVNRRIITTKVGCVWLTHIIS